METAHSKERDQLRQRIDTEPKQFFQAERVFGFNFPGQVYLRREVDDKGQLNEACPVATYSIYPSTHMTILSFPTIDDRTHYHPADEKLMNH